MRILIVTVLSPIVNVVSLVYDLQYRRKVLIKEDSSIIASLEGESISIIVLVLILSSLIVAAGATSFSGRMSQEDLLEEFLAVIKVERVTHRRKVLPHHHRNGMQVKLYVLIVMYKDIMHDHVLINKNQESFIGRSIHVVVKCFYMNKEKMIKRILDRIRKNLSL